MILTLHDLGNQIHMNSYKSRLKPYRSRRRGLVSLSCFEVLIHKLKWVDPSTEEEFYFSILEHIPCDCSLWLITYLSLTFNCIVRYM